MPEDYDDEVRRPGGGANFPATVYAAGVIWIVFGCVILLNALLTLFLAPAPPQAGEDQRPPNTCSVLMGVLFGAVFIHVGLQSVKGPAKDTLGNAVGSILLGLGNGAFGAMMVVGGLATGGTVGVVSCVAGGVGVLCGLGLLTAGALALAGRSDYKAWRRAQKAVRAPDER
jgi:hypothetical protein